jgi:hypothetical protein
MYQIPSLRTPPVETLAQTEPASMTAAFGLEREGEPADGLPPYSSKERMPAAPPTQVFRPRGGALHARDEPPTPRATDQPRRPRAERGDRLRVHAAVPASAPVEMMEPLSTTPALVRAEAGEQPQLLVVLEPLAMRRS